MLVLPRGIELNVVGLRSGVTTCDSVMDWVMAAQRGNIELSDSASMVDDSIANRLVVADLRIDFPHDNELTLTASLSRIDAADADKVIQSWPLARLGTLDLTANMQGLFETYALMSLGTAILGACEDPNVAVADLKAAADDSVAGLLDSVHDAPSHAAPRALVGDMPKAAGTIRLTVDAQGGLGTERLTPTLVGGVSVMVTDPASMFQGIEIARSHERTSPTDGEAP
jgi:hypothetical protein